MAAMLKHPDGADSASIRDAFAVASVTGRPSLTAIYITLDKLDRKNLVCWVRSESAADGPTDGARKDRRYALTARGLDLFRRFVSSRRHLPG